MKVEPSFGQEGASEQATITPTPDWLEQLCGWVRRAPGDLGPLVWPVVLMPQRIGPTFAFPADARTVYQRVRWDATLPAGPLELRARVASVAVRSLGTEVAVVTTASSSDTVVAENQVVVRTERPLPAWGDEHMPPVPSAAGERRRLSFALSEHDVAAFAELSGVHEPIHEDTAYAWRLGLANVLVQELTLLLIVMQVAGATSPGSVEMWFPDPAPVGSLLTLWQGADMWEVRLAATGAQVAVGHIGGPHRPNGRCA